MSLFDFFKKKKEESFVSEYLNKKSYEETDSYFNNINISSEIDEFLFCMSIQDIFNISSKGVVVVGEISSGDIHVGETIKIVRNDEVLVTAEVIGIEQFRKVKNYARQGENVGILLKNVHKSMLQIGDKLTK